MKKRLEKYWLRSWIVTLPIALVFLFWARGTHERWHDFTVRHHTSENLDLHGVGALELEHMLRSAKVALTSRDTNARLASAGLETVHLYLTEGAHQRLDSNLPHTGFEYVEGGMFYDGEVHEVDLRYRGDNVYHWGYWKKSWRVKTKRGSLYKGMRRFNLIAPRTVEALNNYFSYKLASRMGLVAPYTEIVNVALNGELLGLYVLTEQLEESTVRRHDLMPGDVYSGELVGMDAYQGIQNALFDHPGAWTKVAINNHFAEDALTPLEELLDAVQRGDSMQGQERLEELVDLDAFGRFSAFEALACTVHIDSVHNWRLYYDPWRTEFVPIVWDPVGWHRTMIPRPQTPLRPDVISSPLHVALFRNADFLRARSAAFVEFFESGLDVEFLEDARRTIESLRPALELDPNLVADVALRTPAEVEAGMHQLLATITSLFDDLRRVHVTDVDHAVHFRPGAGGRLALEVRGRRPIGELELRFDRSLEGPVGAALEWRTARGTERVDVSGAAQVTGGTLTLAAGLVAHHKLSITSLDPTTAWSNGLVIAPGRYDLELSTRTEPGRLTGVRFRLAGSDRWETARASASFDEGSLGRTYSAVQPAPVRVPEVWSGERIISGDLIVDDDLIIRPGTNVRLASGANLLLRGRVVAEGTAEAPISFVPLEEGQEPWGVVAIKAEGANGSRFVRCVFRDGSGWKLPLAEYSAMFSIHDVQDVLVADCHFADSRVVDDMVHGVYSDVRFLRCLFERSLFDALDMDISVVSVEGCEFIESGNDAVDLMTTRATIRDTRFVDSSDKGISVGEHSYLVALNTLMLRCAIGVQSKDESVAALLHCDFIDCAHAVDAYKKNWRYDGGGNAFLYKSRLIGNDLVITADSNSRIFVSDTYIDREFDYRPRRIRLDASVKGGTSTRAFSSTLERAEAEQTALDGLGRDLFELVDPTRRGSTLYEAP